MGYGDLYAASNGGRVVAIITALTGTLSISLIAVTLSSMLNFSSSERLAFDLYGRLEVKNIIRKMSAKFFISSFKYLVAKTKYIKSLTDKSSDAEVAKKKNELLKVLYKRWMIKRQFKNLLQ